MYPLTCPDGNAHNFENPLNVDSYTCSLCNLSYIKFLKFDNLRTKLKTSTKELVDSVYGGTPEFLAEVMFEAMHSTHRTIQQDFFRGLVFFIAKMKDMPTDLRNEACVGWCKEVSKIKTNFPRI
jgi:hypothetical protein